MPILPNRMLHWEYQIFLDTRQSIWICHCYLIQHPVDFLMTPLSSSSSLCFWTSSIMDGSMRRCFCLTKVKWKVQDVPQSHFAANLRHQETEQTHPKGVASLRSILCVIVSQSPTLESCFENTYIYIYIYIFFVLLATASKTYIGSVLFRTSSYTSAKQASRVPTGSKQDNSPHNDDVKDVSVLL